MSAPQLPPIASESLDERQALAAWIEGIKQRFRVEVPAIARRTSPPTSPSTIYRWLDPNHPFNPSLTKIRKIASAFDIPPPPLPGLYVELRAMHEATSEHGDDFGGLTEGPGQKRFRIGSRALELAGYRPGDFVLVDYALQPKADDIVCVELFDFTAAAWRPAFRLYSPPFVTTATMDPQLKEAPRLIDDNTVKLVGTVVRSLRVRGG